MDINLKDDEVYTIIDALDFYSRIWIGQYDTILREIRWYKNCSQLDSFEYELKTLLLNIRHNLLPELDNYGIYASHGIFSSEINYKAAVAYNMQQEFRYKLAYFNHPEGGITVDFNSPMKAELDPNPFPNATCNKIDDNVIVTLTINKEQLEIIINALSIKKAQLKGLVSDIFKYYTDNKNIIRLAEKINTIFASIDNEMDNLLNNDISKIDNIINSLSKVFIN